MHSMNSVRAIQVFIFVRFYNMTHTLPYKHCTSGHVLSFSLCFLIFISIFSLYLLMYLLYLYAIHALHESGWVVWGLCLRRRISARLKAHRSCISNDSSRGDTTLVFLG